MRNERELFEWHVMRHLDAAFSLARWYLRDGHDAEDVVQDSILKAFQGFRDFRGSDAKPWLLQIVRNGCLRHLERSRRVEMKSYDDAEDLVFTVSDDADPEAQLLRGADAERVREAIQALPQPFREAIVLREFQDQSYDEIARIVDVPIGTVMSRLSRARSMLARALRDDVREAKA